MDIKKILSYVDHTLLAQGATWDEIKAILDEIPHEGTIEFRDIKNNAFAFCFGNPPYAIDDMGDECQRTENYRQKSPPI